MLMSPPHPFTRASLRPLLLHTAALPIYIAVGLLELARRNLVTYARLGGVSLPVALLPSPPQLQRASATALTTIAAATWGCCGELDAIAGSAASCAVTGSSVGGALLVGAAVGRSLPVVLAAAARCGLPTTPASILAVGIGSAAGMVTGTVLSPVALAATAGFRALLELSLNLPGLSLAVGARVSTAIGAAAGALTYLGAEHGYYHRIVLPLILVEMEPSPCAFALIGSLDLCALCLTSAGVSDSDFGAILGPLTSRAVRSVQHAIGVRQQCTLVCDALSGAGANWRLRSGCYSVCRASIPLSSTVPAHQVCAGIWASPRTPPGERRLARFGTLQPLLVGDFIEAAYPFVGRSPAIFNSCVLGSALAGALIWRGGCRSTVRLQLRHGV